MTDLVVWINAQQRLVLPIAPPTADPFLQRGYPDPLPFDPGDFPLEMLKQMPGKVRHDCPVYEIFLLEDPTTRATMILNGEGDAIYSVPAPTDYNPYAYAEAKFPELYSGTLGKMQTAALLAQYDPARIQVSVMLVPEDFYENYLAASRAMDAVSSPESGGGMQMLGGGSFVITGVAHITPVNSHLELTFPGDDTCYYTIESCNDPDLAHWTPVDLFLGDVGDMVWSDQEVIGSPRFYRVRQILQSAPEDQDQDGLDDLTELALGTDPLNADTDGDGIPDGDEIDLGLDPNAWDDVDFVASAQIQVKSYTAIRQKFQQLQAYTAPGLPIPNPPVYYLRATVDAKMDYDWDMGTSIEHRRKWHRFGSVTVDPATMRPNGEYTAIFDDERMYANTDLTYTFVYSWADGVPDLAITAEGTFAGDPVVVPEGEGRCPPYLKDAEYGEDLSVAEPFRRDFIGDGSVDYDRIAYDYDETAVGGEWTMQVYGSAELSREFTTELLNELTEQSLDDMPSLEVPWPNLPWGTHHTRSWPSGYCEEVLIYADGGASGLRELNADDQHTLKLRRVKFRFYVGSTQLGKVYALRWAERFQPISPNVGDDIYQYRTVFFVGTGGAVHVGVPTDSTGGGAPYAPLAGPDHGDDFTLDPPPYQQGNGSVTVEIADYDLPLRFKVDLDIDADYDGAITEEDDPIETDPGGLVGVNDVMLNAIQDRLVPIHLRIEPEEDLEGVAELRVHGPPSRIRLWTSPDMQTEATTLVWDLGAGDTLPDVLYIEGLSVSTSPKDVALTLVYNEPNEDPPVEDRIVLTVARADLLMDINLDGTFDAADDALEANAPGKVLNLAAGAREELQLGLLPSVWREAGTSLLLHASDPAILRVFDPSGAQVIGPGTGDTWTKPVDEIDGYVWPASFAFEGAAFGETTLTLTLKDGAGEALCRDVVQVTVIAIEFLDKSGLPTDELFISKWPGAFTATGSNPPLNPGFINADPDHFRIRVSTLPDAATSLPLFLSTEHDESSPWNDVENEITLGRTAPGSYVSETMILVSNNIDDDETHSYPNLRISGGPDDSIDDRTYIARLGSQVNARFSLLGAECHATATVPKTRRVFLNVKILKDGNGNDAVQKSRVEEMLDITRELYSQVGIEVDWNDTTLTVDANPAGVDLSNGIAILAPIGNPTSSGLTPLAQNIVDKLGTPTSNADLHVFFVKPPFRTRALGPANQATGISLNADAVGFGVTPGYLFNAFIIDEPNMQVPGTSLPLGSVFTLAHELGHLLGITGHEAGTLGQQWRLMHPVWVEHNDVNNPKRLVGWEESTFHDSNHVEAIP